MLEAKETIQAEKQTKLEISSGILQLRFFRSMLFELCYRFPQSC